LKDNKKYIQIFTLTLSVIAISLSQMKPLYTYFEKPQLDILVGKSIEFYDNFGNLGVYLFFQVINRGDASGTLKKVEISIVSNDGNYSKNLKAQSYFLQPDTIKLNDIVTQIPFSYITVEKKSIWSNYIHAYENIGKDKRDEFSELSKKVQIDIDSKLIPNRPRVRIEKKLLEKIIKFSNSNLELHKGDHKILVLGWLQDEIEPSIRKAYEFSIYEVDLSRLKRKEKEYPFGGGIIYPLSGNIIEQSKFQSTILEINNEFLLKDMYSSYVETK